MSGTLSQPGLLVRLAETGRERIRFRLNGQALDGLLGDTVLTALLTHSTILRHTEFSGQARAGFCLMGACQDCWISTESGARLRACSTFLEPGMCLVTTADPAP